MASITVAISAAGTPDECSAEMSAAWSVVSSDIGRVELDEGLMFVGAYGSKVSGFGLATHIGRAGGKGGALELVVVPGVAGVAPPDIIEALSSGFKGDVVA